MQTYGATRRLQRARLQRDFVITSLFCWPQDKEKHNNCVPLQRGRKNRDMKTPAPQRATHTSRNARPHNASMCTVSNTSLLRDRTAYVHWKHMASKSNPIAAINDIRRVHSLWYITPSHSVRTLKAHGLQVRSHRGNQWHGACWIGMIGCVSDEQRLIGFLDKNKCDLGRVKYISRTEIWHWKIWRDNKKFFLKLEYRWKSSRYKMKYMYKHAGQR